MQHRLSGRLTAVLAASFVALFVTGYAFAVAPDLAAVDRYIEAARSDWSVPGLAVAIVKDDELLFAKGYGVREIGGDEPVDAATLFAIASNTKAFTAAALAVLVDEGKIDWDDRVVEHLPYFQLYDPYVTREMRVRDLLCHRSGLGRFSGDLIWWGTHYNPEEILRRVRHLPAAGPFRAHYGYSNVMFIAAGEIAARVSGRSFGELVEERFLKPLGMSRTVSSVAALEHLPNVATPHGEVDSKLVTFPWQPWDNSVAAGGLISSVNDMSRWLRLQLRRGELEGEALFSRETADEMWKAHTPIPLSATDRKRYPSTHFRAYGLGWALMDFRGRQVVTHSGGFDGMFSRVALVPEENLGLVILSNSMTGLPTALSNRILDTFLNDEPRDWSRELLAAANREKESRATRVEQAVRQRKPGTTPSLALAEYAGTYNGEVYGEVDVLVEQDGLSLHFRPNPDLVADLRHLHFDTFLVEWRRAFPWFGKGTVQFVLAAAGEVAEMKIDVPNDDFWFTELDLARK